jgi:hypothetical protein
LVGRGNAFRLDVHLGRVGVCRGRRYGYVVGAMKSRGITISVDAYTSDGRTLRVSRRFDEVSLAFMRDPVTFLLNTINELQAESNKALREDTPPADTLEQYIAEDLRKGEDSIGLKALREIEGKEND